jgi:hypothetical protein
VISIPHAIDTPSSRPVRLPIFAVPCYVPTSSLPPSVPGQPRRSKVHLRHRRSVYLSFPATNISPLDRSLIFVLSFATRASSLSALSFQPTTSADFNVKPAKSPSKLARRKRLLSSRMPSSQEGLCRDDGASLPSSLRSCRLRPSQSLSPARVGIVP